MFKFMFWSFADYEGASLSVSPVMSPLSLQRVADWLVDTALFEQAWWLVSTDGMTGGGANSCVCSQSVHGQSSSTNTVCSVISSLTVPYKEPGSRYNIKHLWAYTLLGQLVAISVASNLFYLAILCSPSSPSKQPTKKTIAMSPLIYLSVLLSLATVAISPHTDKTTFLPNLLVMHVFITVPLFFPQPPSRAPSKWSLSPSTAYFLVFLSPYQYGQGQSYRHSPRLPPRARTRVLSRSSSKLGKPYIGNTAQSSIGWDVVWTTASFIVWAAVTDPNSGLAGATYDAKRRSRMWTVPYLLVAAPFASVGVTAPYVLRPATARRR
ncbi:hypothetical protein BKA70DRAFT_528003 [Coprinopsis sp. MPI-PUGE-AT-0042]|nr:hypothetical protein BKA70DRAFT_528003 [Coprinopsis sp. MPI-PUGE-AT-0042]